MPFSLKTARQGLHRHVPGTLQLTMFNIIGTMCYAAVKVLVEPIFCALMTLEKGADSKEIWRKD